MRAGNFQPHVTLAGRRVPVTYTVNGDRYRINFGNTRIAIKTDHALEVLLG